ncbi:aldehyde ferredoxin oxidoreductase [candidate division NPL-UPA2 bacterium Unc8]|uniref:Aldehyde ferredoxin oxidoreductase n=1 Tax=candidate division NPL-UPA2 bacterium Unc8 TaxID=1980939 RepID=A0A399FV33_UNCN2|nr:MAG: aldehyde ferredoxin oxidoreductase [candidate division NPL-UPA2 bacterium Unc8]
MSYGYWGRIINVDLSNGEIQVESLPDELYKDFIGGYGLGVRIIYERQKPGIHPLSENSILGFTPGLLTGTRALFSSRYMVGGKSPLTGGWGDANSGGSFSLALKQTGYDAVFFKGISPHPVYLWIDNDRIELRDARFLWGKDTVETETALRSEFDDEKVMVACIGPAGEKLSLISGVVSDSGRIAARSGLGALMGSKKLKAVAVRGSCVVPVYDKRGILSGNKQYLRSFNFPSLRDRLSVRALAFAFMAKLMRRSLIRPSIKSTMYQQVLRKYGTCGTTAFSCESGDAPVKNWKGIGAIDFPVSTMSHKISDEEIIKYEKKKVFCPNCPIGCGGTTELKDGPYKLPGESRKVEYETLTAFGPLCLIDNLEAIMLLNDLCNRAGIDTISTGGVMAFAMECYEVGLLTKTDMDGIQLTWGNADAAIALLKKIISREGIGDMLADGVKVASEKIGRGSDAFAIHAGGQEVPMHDPRHEPTLGTAYEAEPTPGRHTISCRLWQEMLRLERIFPELEKIPSFSIRAEKYKYHGAATLQAYNSKFAQVANCAGLCLFGGITGPIPLVEWINAATGWDYSPHDYLLTGERIETLRHSFNLREGITLKDTRLSDRAIGKPPLKKGPLGKITIDTNTLVKEFYEKMFWDPETGKPSDRRLKHLGLDKIVRGCIK